jgi:hypothetical protein
MRLVRIAARVAVVLPPLVALSFACSAAGGGDTPAPAKGGAGGVAGASGAAGASGIGGGSGAPPDASLDVGGSGGGGVIPDPTSCAQAATGHTYLGCDFWPTVTDNIVAPIFDFAVVVANPGDTDADVAVTRAGADVAKATVPAGSLTKIYLPWVAELKSLSWIQGQPDNGCPTWVKTSTVSAKGGAYHLTASRPVAVYQFNAIEYAAKAGPAGKDWQTYCSKNTCMGQLKGKCFSYTNDASLLLPSTALTGNYRVAGTSPWTQVDMTDPVNPKEFTYPAYFAVTGTRDNTNVTVKVSSTGSIAAGGGVPATAGGGTATFSLNAGDVMMVVGIKGADFSGTLVTATEPVQVVAGISCTQMPHGLEACDHLEENVLPAETLGKHYFVTVPSGPSGFPDWHVVRLYGNVDGTQLTYPAGNPGLPATIDAGQMVELDHVSQDFEVVGDHELTVASFQHGQGPIGSTRRGDPAMSFMTTVEQYRVKYVFLAPDDYDVSLADIVQPMDAVLQLDGQPVAAQPTAIGSGYGVTRVKLGLGSAGAHVLESDKPVGLQVLGYGDYTSYQYPGGLNLGLIAPPPVK